MESLNILAMVTDLLAHDNNRATPTAAIGLVDPCHHLQEGGEVWSSILHPRSVMVLCNGCDLWRSMTTLIISLIMSCPDPLPEVMVI